MRPTKLSLKLLTAILSAGILSFLGILDETATTVTFPLLTREFAITTGQVQWVNTIVLLVIAIIVPLSSQIKLKFSTKHIFLVGISIFILGLLLDIVSPRFDLLLVGRALQGIGTGIGLPLMYNIILEKVPKDRLDFLMGIGTMITAAAVAIGPVFGGIVTQLLNWRWIFIFSLILGLIGLIGGLTSIPELAKSPTKISFRFFQWTWLSMALILLMVGFTNIIKKSLFSFQAGGLIILGCISLSIWLRLSWKDKNALIHPNIFKDIHFSMQLICYCLAKITTLALGFILPIYIQLVNYGSVSLSGWLLLPGAIGDALMAAAGGKILAKKGARLPIMSGTIASLSSLLIFILLDKHLSNMVLLLLYVLYYSGYGMSFSCLMTSGLTSLPKKEQAQGNAVYNTLQQFSGALGTALAGTILANSQANKHLTLSQSTTQGGKWIFIVLTTLTIANLILGSIFIPKKKEN